MTFLYLIPRWFFGYDIALEILFGVITMAVAVYSFRLYNISKEIGCRNLGIGFLFISLAHILWSGINLSVSTALNTAARGVSLEKLTRLGFVGVSGYVMLSILGLTMILYTTLPQRSQRTFSIVASLALIVPIFASYKALAFYFVSSLLLFFIVFHYASRYIKYKSKSDPLVLIAFIFIFFGTLDFTFATLDYTHYVLGHVLQFIGYGLVLGSLIKTLRR
jgi:hypothetical protein